MNRDGSGKEYRAEDYRAVTPMAEGKAYLTITTTLETQQNDRGGHFLYSFLMKEENGIGIRLDRIEYVMFFYEGSAAAEVFSPEDIAGWGDDPYIEPYGLYKMDFGNNAKTPDGRPNIIGAGFQAWGTDDQGAQLSFTAYLPLPQE